MSISKLITFFKFYVDQVYRMMFHQDIEPLVEENPCRFTMFPIEHMPIYEMYLTHKKTVWFAEEIDLSQDEQCWNQLSDPERHFLSCVLAFFASSDGIVLENLALRFFKEMQWSEVRAFYSVQLFIENEHSLMYSRLIDAYIKDPLRKEYLFQAINHPTLFPTITEKANWAQKWIADETSTLASRLVAFACVEGIFFSGSFCSIYWMKERGLLPGLCSSNDLIARDEGLHTDFACLLYKLYIKNRLLESEVISMIKEAVAIENRFINESLPCAVLGMKAESMQMYIQYVANRLFQQLGYTASIYTNIHQPFPFMDRICIESQTNFFEGSEVNYQRNIETLSLDNLVQTDDF